MEQQREFKGIWIEKEIWLDKRLNALEKVILMEIDSLDNEETGCYASNQYLAEFCQCSETKISTAISKLIDLGYLYVKSFDGRIRVLKSRVSKNERQDLKILKADIKKVKENNIVNNKDNNIKPNIKQIFDFWNSQNIIIHKELKPDIVKQIEKTLKEYSLENIKKYIERYSTVIKDNNYYFNTKWSLVEFLKQKNAMLDFTDEGSKWLNYLNKKPTNRNAFVGRNYKEQDMNKLFDDFDSVEL